MKMENLQIIPALLVTLQTLFVLISPLLYFLLGQIVSSWIHKNDSSSKLEVPTAFVLGLLVYLTGAFFIMTCCTTIGLPGRLSWLIAALLPFLPLVLKRAELLNYLKSIKILPSINFTIWFFIVLSLGLALFQAVKGIETPWANNYGDLTFHVGMISSFTLGGNIPPEYHIFPGTRLSYPFLINLWTSTYWWIYPGFKTLSLIFAFQWTLIWCATFYLLRGHKYWLLPWAVLFGGGSYYLFNLADPQQISAAFDASFLKGVKLILASTVNGYKYSWPLIHKGIPWAVFLTTIWITQRTALLGMVCCLAALKLLLNTSKDWSATKTEGLTGKFIVSGLILGLSILTNTHFWIAAVLFSGAFLTLSLVQAILKMPEEKKTKLKDYFSFCLSISPAILFLPWLLGKGSILSFMWGWTVKSADFSAKLNFPNLGPFSDSAVMWCYSALPWLIIMPILWIITRRHKEFISLLLVFLAGNLVKLSYWDWDQMKIFLGLYLIFILVWSTIRNHSAYLAHSLCLILIVPGLVECYRLFLDAPNFTVYSKKDLEIAEEVVKITEPSAIIAAAPKHNSLITLTGRKLFLGYDGTIWSHGLKADKQKELMRSPNSLAGCSSAKGFDSNLICPKYLLWTEAERRHWKRGLPGRGFRKTKSKYIYLVEQHA